MDVDLRLYFRFAILLQRQNGSAGCLPCPGFGDFDVNIVNKFVWVHHKGIVDYNDIFGDTGGIIYTGEDIKISEAAGMFYPA